MRQPDTSRGLGLAPLAGNPFPDATLEFLWSFGTALSLGLAAPIEIVAPYSALQKEDVIGLGAALGVPFELTLSCMNPDGTGHCGLCSKCRERRDAFIAAGIPDPTHTPIQARGNQGLSTQRRKNIGLCAQRLCVEKQ